MEGIGARIKEIREREGLSQSEFGKTLGLSGASVSQVEAGTRKPALQTVLEIAGKYCVTTDFLLRGITGSPDSRLGALLQETQRLSVRDQLLLEKIIRAFLDTDSE